MEPDDVVRTLNELVAERSADVQVFRALSRRFHANAVEFFPPQIDAVVAAFARLGYADEELLRGFAGRLLDVASDASPRRVVRLLRHGAALQLPPGSWVEAVLPQLRRHISCLQEGLPSALASLHALRWRDPQLAELLVVRVLLVSERLGDAFFTKAFECWSRHGLRHQEAEERAVALASSSRVHELDLRDALNLLAGLRRCPDGEEAAGILTGQLAARLEGKAPRGQGGGSAVVPAASATADEAAAAALWMERLVLRSPRLQAACCEVMELAIADWSFRLQVLPGAVAALAAQGAAPDGGDASTLATVSMFLDAANLGQHSASQVLDLLRAACMLRLHDIGDDARAVKLLARAARAAPQLTLPERRTLLECAEGLADSPEAAPHLAAVRDLPMVPLPALVGFGKEADWSSADVGAGSVLLPPGGEAQQAVRLAAFGDLFAARGGGKAKALDPKRATPACRLSLRALEKQGWAVELRA